MRTSDELGSSPLSATVATEAPIVATAADPALLRTAGDRESSTEAAAVVDAPTAGDAVVAPSAAAATVEAATAVDASAPAAAAGAPKVAVGGDPGTWATATAGRTLSADGVIDAPTTKVEVTVDDATAAAAAAGIEEPAEVSGLVPTTAAVAVEPSRAVGEGAVKVEGAPE